MDECMDYEKKYKEALDRARELHKEAIEKGYVDDYRKDYETIFPELAESEDERIRKEIIAFLKHYHTGEGDFITYNDDWIAYLEKQKETSLGKYSEETNQGRQIKKGDKVRIHCRKDRQISTISIYDDKVGEVIDIWDAKRNPWGHIGVRLDNGCNDGFYEDELEVIDEPSWKPSEQEKGALRTAIYVLTDERSFPKTAAQLQNILDAFEGKESRKDWKPSEEQMEALLNAEKYLNAGLQYGSATRIAKLYEQLKKLM